MKGKLHKFIIVLSIILCLQIKQTAGQPVKNVTTKHDAVEEKKIIPSKSNNKTMAELITQQTENVKKIVAVQNQQQQQAGTIDYPVVTKLDPDYSVEAKKQIENIPLEELKIKCQHISKLLQMNKTASYEAINTNPINLIGPSNHKPYDYQRPVYNPQQIATYKPRYSTTAKPNGFYITQRTTTRKPVVHTTQPTPIKYIRLEPVILQKTILSDGRTVFYWHRSLPTAVEIASDLIKNNQVSTSQDQIYPAYNYYTSQSPYRNIPYYENTYYKNAYLPQTPYVTPYQSSTEDISTDQQTTTSTTEAASSSYGFGFGSFLPFYSYSRQEPTSTTTESTSTTTTTPEPTTQKVKPDDLLYAQQLKFIIPVPYEGMHPGSSVPVKNLWDFDQYAYYPKQLQPNRVNVEVPYNPTFHMIRAVAVPDSVSKSNEDARSDA